MPGRSMLLALVVVSGFDAWGQTLPNRAAHSVINNMTGRIWTSGCIMPLPITRRSI